MCYIVRTTASIVRVMSFTSLALLNLLRCSKKQSGCFGNIPIKLTNDKSISVHMWHASARTRLQFRLIDVSLDKTLFRFRFVSGVSLRAKRKYFRSFILCTKCPPLPVHMGYLRCVARVHVVLKITRDFARCSCGPTSGTVRARNWTKCTCWARSVRDNQLGLKLGSF